MPTHVALLRGINVGRGNRMAMADLRAAAESLGHTDVSTYINSGNVVFTASRAKAADLATALERAVAEGTGVTCAVIVLTKAAFARAVEANPYAEEPNGKYVHAGFAQDGLDAAAGRRVDEAVERAASAGSPDKGTVLGGVLYLHTPTGLSRSKLAEELTSAKGPDKVTMRNWSTVTKLAALLES